MLELSLGFHMFLGVSSTTEQHLSLTFTTTAKTEGKPYLKGKKMAQDPHYFPAENKDILGRIQECEM